MKCALILLFSALFLAGCADRKNSVVLYTSQDQFAAEPVLKDFTAKTGIEVRAVYDTESAKTAGLARRLWAEHSHPQCDVFWSNEEMYLRLLAQTNVLAPNGWRAAGYRTRCYVVNTNRVAMKEVPRDLLELTNSIWRGKVALAYPLFGTTSSHFLALRLHWGEDLWKQWCEGLVKNQAKVVDGNSVVVKLVGAGEAWIGLTDSDDVTAGIKEHLPVAPADLGPESFVIRSTAGLVEGAPHPDAARALIDFLCGRDAIGQLVKAGVLQGVNPDEASSNLAIVWPTAATDLDEANKFLRWLFIRA